MILVFAAAVLVVTAACTTPIVEVTASPVTIPPTASPGSIEPSPTPAGTATPTTPTATAPEAITRVTTAALGDLRGGRVYALKQYAVQPAGLTVRELWSSTLEGASVTTLAVRFEGPQEVRLLDPPGLEFATSSPPTGDASWSPAPTTC